MDKETDILYILDEEENKYVHQYLGNVAITSTLRKYHSNENCEFYEKKKWPCVYCKEGSIGVDPELLKLPDNEIDKLLNKK